MVRNNQIQTAKVGYIIISILLCILGIVLIIVPDFSLILLCRLSGILLVLFGIVKIIGYCSKDLYRLAFQYDLAFGILLSALGVIMIFRTSTMIPLLCILFGILVLADALLKIQIAIDSKNFGIQKWRLILLAAITTGVMGFLLVFCPSKSAEILMIILGLSLLAEGILNLITFLTAVKISHRMKPKIIDGDCIEIDSTRIDL